MSTIAEHGEEKIACPHCGSKNLEQRWPAFSGIVTKKRPSDASRSSGTPLFR